MFDFLKIRETVDGLGSKIKAVRSEIEATRQRMEFVFNSNAHPDDILTAAREWLEGLARKYDAYFSDGVFSHFNKPAAQLGTDQFTNGLHFCHLTADASPHVFVGLIGVDRFMEIFKDHAAKMPPDSYGPKKSERGPILAELEKKLKKLLDEEAKLIDGAAAAGLNVV